MLTIMRLAPMEWALLIMLIIFCIMGAMGLYEAWSKKRGVLGWIVSFVTLIAGGAAAMTLSISIGDAMISNNAPVGEVFNMLSPILTFVGSWLALRLVNRFR